MSDLNGDPSSPVRVRRTTTKVVNYAKEQEFSDAEDLFEGDSDDEAKPRRSVTVRTKPSRPSAGSARDRSSIETSTIVKGGIGEHLPEEDDHHLYQNQHPIYTEKGYDPNLAPIRERFSFLPEYEEDGSPKIELIVGRRPVDENEETRNKNNDDNLEDDDVGHSNLHKSSITPTKSSKKRGKDDSPTKRKVGTPDSSSADQVIEYEYLVKYKGRSYLHLEWKTGADLESMNKSAKGIYRRYIKKLAAPGTDLEELESPECDPSFLVPEKVLDEADQEISEELSDKELLKWEQQRAKELEKDDEEDDFESPSKRSTHSTDIKVDKGKKGESF
jgi:hypothetical protein